LKRERGVASPQKNIFSCRVQIICGQRKIRVEPANTTMKASVKRNRRVYEIATVDYAGISNKNEVMTIHTLQKIPHAPQNQQV
jgi:hypothetical protein